MCNASGLLEAVILVDNLWRGLALIIGSLDNLGLGGAGASWWRIWWNRVIIVAVDIMGDLVIIWGRSVGSNLELLSSQDASDLDWSVIDEVVAANGLGSRFVALISLLGVASSEEESIGCSLILSPPFLESGGETGG